MPNSDLEARVLVCDPKNVIFPELPRMLHERFGKGELPGWVSLNAVRQFERFEVSNVEFTLIDDIEEVSQEVRRRTHRNDPPHYSLIVYESEQVQKDGIAKVIAGIRNHDYFLPQMVFGRGLDPSTIGHCARAGALYFSETTENAEEQIKSIFKKSRRLPGLTVVKIGGSAFDFDRYNGHNLNLERVCNVLADIHQERSETVQERRVNRIICTVGAGQYGDIPKDWLIKYGHITKVQEQFPQLMAEALTSNLKILKTLFDQKAKNLTTGAFYFINNGSASKRIILIGTAPHYIMARDQIPLQDSDTHTIALAEFYGAQRVVLIKRTDGIYEFDPYRGFPLGAQIGDGSSDYRSILEKWKSSQRNNRRYDTVTVEELLKGNISRTGTNVQGEEDGSTGHLMEDSALRYFIDKCKYVKEIVLVHIAPEEMHYPIGGDRFKHIVTGEIVTIDPKTGWVGVLEQNIRNAFNGVAYSKIVRSNA